MVFLSLSGNQRFPVFVYDKLFKTKTDRKKIYSAENKGVPDTGVHRQSSEKCWSQPYKNGKDASWGKNCPLCLKAGAYSWKKGPEYKGIDKDFKEKVWA